MHVFFISIDEDSFRQDFLDSAAPLLRPLSVRLCHSRGSLFGAFTNRDSLILRNCRFFNKLLMRMRYDQSYPMRTFRLSFLFYIFQIDGNLVAPSDPSNWECEGGVCHQWLYFHLVDGLRLRGRGTIDGRGHKWWQNTVCQQLIYLESFGTHFN